MKKALLLGLALLLVACGGAAPDGPIDASKNDDFSEQAVTLRDGRTVHCLFWANGFAQYKVGGMSCDWGNAK